MCEHNNFIEVISIAESAILSFTDSEWCWLHGWCEECGAVLILSSKEKTPEWRLIKNNAASSFASKVRSISPGIKT